MDTLTVEGSIQANGNVGGSGKGGGSGGSMWITASQIEGSGTIQVKCTAANVKALLQYTRPSYREVNKKLLDGQFSIFLPKNPGK